MSRKPWIILPPAPGRGPRAEILAAANRHRIGLEPYRMRHIQQAVAVVRHHRAVAPRVLKAAGFNPKGGKR